MLRSHGELWNRCRLSRLVRAARLDEHSASARSAAAVINHGKNLLVREELIQVFHELPAPHDLCHAKRRTLPRNLIFTYLGESLVVESLVRQLRNRLHLRI